MTSENKKRKAKNSYIYNGGEKEDTKMKRTMYFTKHHRKKLKDMLKKMFEDIERE